MAQRLKRLPLMRETRVRSLGGEDPLEKEMVTHSNILAWRIPWTGKPGRLQSMGSQRGRQTRLSDFTFFLFLIHICCTHMFYFSWITYLRVKWLWGMYSIQLLRKLLNYFIKYFTFYIPTRNI